MFRSSADRIVRSREVAEMFINESLHGYRIKHVQEDGFCIINAFKEGISTLGIGHNFDDIIFCIAY